MRHIFNGVATDGNGKILPGATITVYLANSNTKANIYTSISGGSAVNSVQSSSVDGTFLFYIDRKDYSSEQLFKIVISYSGSLGVFADYEYDYIKILDESDILDIREFLPYGFKQDASVDYTTEIQNAINNLSGRGTLCITHPLAISQSLTFPSFATGISPITLMSNNPYKGMIVNKATANTPTLSITTQLVRIHNLGLIGHQSYENNLISIDGGAVIRIDKCFLRPNGHAIVLKDCHTVFIEGNGGVSANSQNLIPQGSDWDITGKSHAFVKIDDAAGEAVNHIIIQNNNNEGLNQAVATTKTSSPVYHQNWMIVGNQFEGTDGKNALQIYGVRNLDIQGNYSSEGASVDEESYDIEACEAISIGSNYHHYDSMDGIRHAVLLNGCSYVNLFGQITRLILRNQINSVICHGNWIYRIQDESTGGIGVFFKDCHFSDMPSTMPDQKLNGRSGQRAWYTDTDPTAGTLMLYPGQDIGDKIWKKTPAPGASPGWVCTTTAVIGTLTQVVGTGPDPVLIAGYYQYTAYDWKIIITTGGATGTAVYKVQNKTKGGGTYADFETGIVTSEVAHLVKLSSNLAFQIRWPTGQTYVAGDEWEITDNIAPVWSPMLSIPLKFSSQWNAASIANGAIESKVFTVTGAALGDHVKASLDVDIQDMTLDCNVTATDQVTCVLTNNTGAAVDLPNATVYIELEKR